MWPIQTAQRIAYVLLLAVAFTIVTACGEGNLRGRWEKSTDGKTYLAVVDDNGGKCGPLLVDGKPWPYKIGEPGPISPGRHNIECGAGLAFEIPEGVVFRFDYWGP
jgi:hypothetical protein